MKIIIPDNMNNCSNDKHTDEDDNNNIGMLDQYNSVMMNEEILDSHMQDP